MQTNQHSKLLNRTEEPKAPKTGGKKVPRREFLKYTSVAAVAAGAVAMIDKLPIASTQTNSSPARNASEEPIVATVSGDQLTVMNGEVSVKVKDPGLAALIAEKLNGGN